MAVIKEAIVAGKICECRHLWENHYIDGSNGSCMYTLEGETCSCMMYRDDSGPELCEEHGIIKVACRACYEAENPEPVCPLTDAEIREAVAPIGFEHPELVRYQAVASAQLKKVLDRAGNIETLTEVIFREFERQAKFGYSPGEKDIAIAVHQYLAKGVLPV